MSIPEEQHRPSKVLVIGSTGHELATECVEWSDEFPYLGDFDLIIVHVPSYVPDVGVEEQHRMARMREQLTDVMQANTSLVCIAAPPGLGVYVNVGNGRAAVPCNYLWSPIALFPTQMSGHETVSVIPDEYFGHVSEWKYYFEKDAWRAHKPWSARLGEALLTNKANKLLAFSLQPSRYGVTLAPISVYPPTRPPQLGIDILLRRFLGHTPTRNIRMPAWARSMRLPGESESERKADTLRASLSVVDRSLEKYNYYKGLLTEQGRTLEDLVSNAFEELDVPLMRRQVTGAGLREDFVLSEGQFAIPIEVKGHRKGMSERDLNQLIARLGVPQEKPKYLCRGVLIGNPWMEEKPSKRKKAFESSLVEIAGIYHIRLLSTRELLNAVVAKIQNDPLAGSFKKTLLSDSGIVSF